MGRRTDFQKKKFFFLVPSFKCTNWSKNLHKSLICQIMTASRSIGAALEVVEEEVVGGVGMSLKVAWSCHSKYSVVKLRHSGSYRALMSQLYGASAEITI